MPIQAITSNVAMGATLMDGGAAFRTWAPRALQVYVLGDFNGWRADDDSRLLPIGEGQWARFVPGATLNQTFLYWVIGKDGPGFKRDPRARELTADPPFPLSNCVLRDPSLFPWHETGYRTPAFNDLVIYQLHTGAFSIPAGRFAGKFLDVALRVPYLENLGVNAIQLLPVVEFPSEYSMGYNGTDYFSPENDYEETSEVALRAYVERINEILEVKGQAPYAYEDLLHSDHQLKALVDLCHVHGIAVLFDVVYNHAGGGFDENSIWFYDRMPKGNNNDSLYFTDQGWVGGLVFAYWNRDVRQFLIDNATFWLEEYRIDGFRCDEVSVMDRFGGWMTCQQITDTCGRLRPDAIRIAEYWPVNSWVVRPTEEGGAGFDATWHDGLRDAVRSAVAQSVGGRNAYVEMGRIAQQLEFSGLRDRWRAVNCVENHDLVRSGRDLRMARLADFSNSRSWYARSRSRVATGLLLTAAGIPLLFMGQEFLEDKQWNDYPDETNRIAWEGLESSDRTMVDFLRFTSELIALRRRQPGLRGEGLRVFWVHDIDRVLAFQRWVEGVGQDVVVVASLNESTFARYDLGFPGAGRWLEVFNSDVYDNWVNPMVAGNGGSVEAWGPPMHGMPVSATVTVPANSILVFARER